MMGGIIARGGRFSYSIETDKLAKGLRPSSKNVRNSDYLVSAAGAVVIDGVLQAIPTISPIDTEDLAETFPFPQIFDLVNVTLVCGAKKIYEYADETFTLKYTAAATGGLWTVVDFFNYLYISNGSIAVTRDSQTLAYALTNALPATSAICDFNGQVIIEGAV